MGLDTSRIEERKFAEYKSNEYEEQEEQQEDEEEEKWEQQWRVFLLQHAR